MRLLALVFGFYALLALSLPFSDAQDAPKGADKKDAKKDTPDDEKPKKAEAKRETEQKVVYSAMLSGKLVWLDANSGRDFKVQIPETDPAKVARLRQWQLGEMNRISRANPKDQAREMAQYQIQLARKQSTETTTLKDYDYRAADNCKFRTNTPPIRYDDRGLVKPYTQKELSALRAKSKLPGFPVEFDYLAQGQVVEVYLAKTNTKKQPADKQPADKGDKKDEKPRQDVVMVVVTQEVQAK